MDLLAKLEHFDLNNLVGLARWSDCLRNAKGIDIAS